MMAVAGLMLILAQSLVEDIPPLSTAVILLGVVLVAAGLVGLGSRLQPDRRVYLKLRAEVDDFLRLVRTLNLNAVEGRGAQASETKAAMHDSIERIGEAAGVESDA
jgi:hypothetical protein